MIEEGTMKKIALFFVFFLTSVVYAESFCVGEGERFGNGDGVDEISASCLAEIKERAHPLARKVTSSGIGVYGYLNILYVDDEELFKRPFIIAGSSTHLSSIEALELDEVNKEIALLDQQRVLFFSFNRMGNNTPLRVLNIAPNLHISQLKVFPHKNELHLWDEKEQKVHVFSREANHRERPEKRNSRRLRTFSLKAGAF
jgi:hypothetical protein